MKHGLKKHFSAFTIVMFPLCFGIGLSRLRNGPPRVADPSTGDGKL